MTASSGRPASSTLDVLLDIDGVLYPFPELFTVYVSTVLGRRLELDTSMWAFYEAWGVDDDGFVELVTRGVATGEVWWEGEPYPDVAATIGALRAHGHRIHLVTARDIAGVEPAMEATHHWLRTHGLEVESLNLAQDKPTILARLDLDPARCIAADDAPQHVAAWEAAGVHAVIVDRWGTYRGSHRWVPDLASFAALVDARAAELGCGG